MMGLTLDLGNEAALMDTLRRGPALRNTAAGQSPDQTRHAGFAPAGKVSAMALLFRRHWRFLSGICPNAAFLE
jgi:hypothetical protein